MDRRQVVGLALAGLSGGPAAAQDLAKTELPGDSTEDIILWPGTPPGGEGVHVQVQIREQSPTPELYHLRYITGIQTPRLIVWRPANPNGMGLVIMAGGGYHQQTMEAGGTELARRFTQAGITCFVLRYRLPSEGWAQRADVPLQDAQRAMRLIRSRAAQYKVDPARLAVIGLSAGGHLAASLATRWSAKVYTPIDDADAHDARPIVAAMLYPNISMAKFPHSVAAGNLLGPDPTPQMVDAYSIDRHITPGTPPCFLCSALDDGTVPPMENGIAMLRALVAAKVPAEAHFFQQGGHGFSIHGTIGKPVAAWPDLFLAWAASQGFSPRPS